MTITKEENVKIKNKVRVPHVFQVFPEVSNYLLSNMNIIVYNIHSNVVYGHICIILEIYLSKKIGSNLTPG